MSINYLMATIPPNPFQIPISPILIELMAKKKKIGDNGSHFILILGTILVGPLFL